MRMAFVFGHFHFVIDQRIRLRFPHVSLNICSPGRADCIGGIPMFAVRNVELTKRSMDSEMVEKKLSAHGNKQL